MLKLGKFNLDDFSHFKLGGISAISGGKERTNPTVPEGGSTKATSGGTYDYGSGSFDYQCDTMVYDCNGVNTGGEYHLTGCYA